MNPKTDPDTYSDEETERRAREAIQRSFEMPYKPQKEMVGKTSRPSQRQRAPLKTPKKAK